MKTPSLFLPHGGGPWPVLDLPFMPTHESHSLSRFLKSISSVPLEKPRFLVIISAHWECSNVTVHIGKQPSMFYDYYGMPPASYALQWPAPGAPEEAEKIIQLLKSAGIAVDVERDRGFDHGTFIPMLLAYPQADIPVVQVSLKKGLDAGTHIAIGEALAPVREQGGLIIASGNSFHNLPRIFRPDSQSIRHAQLFTEWLIEAIAGTPHHRNDMLRNWRQAPFARECHPREEHLIPLMVAVGAGRDDIGTITWTGTMNGLSLLACQFG